MTDADDPKPTLARFIADATPELLGAGIGGALQLGGADPVSSGLTAIAVATAMRLDVANWKHQVGRAAYATHLTAEHIGGEEQLERLATSDDHRRELTARVLRAAARTPLEQKLPALARLLADGLDPAGQVNEALVLAAALDDLEAPHIAVLGLLDSEAIGPGLLASADEDAADGAVGWTVEDLDNRLPGYRLVVPALVQTLDRHALIRDASRGTYFDLEGGNRYIVSELGQHCLKLLRDTTA